MKITQVKEIATQRGVKAGKLNKGDLVRTIQQSEDNEPCFDTGKAASCGQAGCLWREDCT